MRIRTSNRRKRNKLPVGQCDCGGNITIRHTYVEVGFIDGPIKVDVRYKSCDRCQIAYMDWRDTAYQDAQLERKSNWKKSKDGLRWIPKDNK